MSRLLVVRGRLLAAAACLAVLAALALVPAPAVDAAPADCPEPVGVADLQARLDAGVAITGTGYTVSAGGTPEEFTVEVLGVIDHWFLPGRHIIVVETGSPAIDKVGGIWFGMSGSPVFDDAGGGLIGGLAWGFSFGPSKLAGLTPAQEMLDLLAHPPGATAGAADLPSTQSGTLSGSLAREARRRDPQAGTRMEPLRLPVPVNARTTTFAQERFDRLRLPLEAVPAGGTGRAASTAFATPQEGGNFAAAFSYGDNAYYASGTTTFACAGYAVAFAHWFDAAGATTMGANDGHTITIVDDSVFGPYKMMNLAGPFGTLDQDRFAGVRALLGVTPQTSAIRTALSDLDSGRATTGATDVVYASLFPIIAALHLWDAIDGTIDRWGPGTSTLDWTVTGRREDGRPWSFTRRNMFADDWDIGFESIWELDELLWTLQSNGLESVSLDRVDIGGTFEQALRRSRIGQVLVSVDGGPFVPLSDGLVVSPGATLDLEIGLTGRSPVTLAVQVPSDAGDFASLIISGGGSFWSDPFHDDGDGTSGQAESFDDLLVALANRSQNNEVVAELFAGDVWEDEPSPGEPPDDPYASAAATAAGTRDRALVDRVVTGEVFVDVFVDPGDDGNGNGDGELTFARVFGRDRIETAIAVAQRSHPEPGATGTVVLARADDYADALAGAPLAAGLDAPLLLTHGRALPPLVGEEISRLGASRAVLLGGAAAISGAVADQLERAGVAVERVGGLDRFDTARLIAGRVGGDHAFLALGSHPDPGRGWPDALAVSALAASEQRPILLTASRTLPAATQRALADLGVASLTVVGGAAAVSDAVVDGARGPDRTVDRLAGRTRYETSLAIARRSVGGGAAQSRLWLATGRNFPDALASGPAVAGDGAVLLLVDGVRLDGSPPVREWLEETGEDLEHVTLVGGSAAISGAVEDELRALLEGG